MHTPNFISKLHPYETRASRYSRIFCMLLTRLMAIGSYYITSSTVYNTNGIISECVHIPII